MSVFKIASLVLFCCVSIPFILFEKYSSSTLETINLLCIYNDDSSAST